MSDPVQPGELAEALRAIAQKLDEASLGLRMIARRLEHGLELPAPEEITAPTPKKKSGEWKLGKEPFKP